MAQPARHRERSRKTLPAGDPKMGLSAEASKVFRTFGLGPLTPRNVQYSDEEEYIKSDTEVGIQMTLYTLSNITAHRPLVGVSHCQLPGTNLGKTDRTRDLLTAHVERIFTAVTVRIE